MERTTGLSLQNLLVKPVSNHKTMPWHQVTPGTAAQLSGSLSSKLAVKSISLSFIVVARSKEADITTTCQSTDTCIRRIYEDTGQNVANLKCIY